MPQLIKSTSCLHMVDGSLRVLRFLRPLRRTDNTMAKRNKEQKDKQRSTKHTYKTKNGVTQTQLKPELMLTCVGMNMTMNKLK